MMGSQETPILGGFAIIWVGFATIPGPCCFCPSCVTLWEQLRFGESMAGMGENRWPISLGTTRHRCEPRYAILGTGSGPAPPATEGGRDSSRCPRCQPRHRWQEDARRLPACQARQSAGGYALSKSASLSVIDSFPDGEWRHPRPPPTPGRSPHIPPTSPPPSAASPSLLQPP